MRKHILRTILAAANERGFFKTTKGNIPVKPLALKERQKRPKRNWLDPEHDIIPENMTVWNIFTDNGAAQET